MTKKFIYYIIERALKKKSNLNVDSREWMLGENPYRNLDEDISEQNRRRFVKRKMRGTLNWVAPRAALVPLRTGVFLLGGNYD